MKMPFAKKFNVLNKLLANKNNVSVKPLLRKTRGRKTYPSKPYQPTDQERKLINSTSGLGTAARQYSRPVSGPTLYSFVQSKRAKYVERHGYRCNQRVPR